MDAITDRLRGLTKGLDTRYIDVVSHSSASTHVTRVVPGSVCASAHLRGPRARVRLCSHLAWLVFERRRGAGRAALLVIPNQLPTPRPYLAGDGSNEGCSGASPRRHHSGA